MRNAKTFVSSASLEMAQLHFAQRVVARLSEGTETLGADVSERLRFAREAALQRARAARATELSARPIGAAGAGSLVLGLLGGRWGLKLASLLPLIGLVAGLVSIQYSQTQAQISVATEIDTDLLADDLPPKAYSDAGFVEFLKLPKD